METPLISAPLILGVGNRYRRDDGVGPMVAEALAERGLDALAVDGDGATLMGLWEDVESGRPVIVVDATRSGAEPGTVRRLDAVATELPTGMGFFNSHAFGLAEAVETARSLGKLPASLIIHGVEGADFTLGEGLSEPVAAAAVALIEAIAGGD